jgi:hypothetical protein
MDSNYADLPDELWERIKEESTKTEEESERKKQTKNKT